MTIRIRQGEARDLNRLVEIYNHYVTNTHVTFDTEAFAVAARTQWFTQFSPAGPHRLFVVEAQDLVVGYATSLPFKAKPAYRKSVETTIYIDAAHTGKGRGRQLYEYLLEVLQEEPSTHRAYAGIALPNPASIRLHETLGFAHVASYHEVGYKFEKYWDVSWYEKDLSVAARPG